MEQMARFVNNLSRGLDRVGGLALAATMVLVTANVVMRFLGSPVQGTYDWAGLLTSLAIGLGLAWCAIQEGHVAVTFLTEKLSSRVQGVIDLVIGIINVLLLVVITWALAVYGTGLFHTGEVSLTAKVPLYPFAYLITLGFLLFALVALLSIWESWRKVVGK